MTLLKSLSILPTPLPNCLCLEISPQVLRGEDPIEENAGVKAGDEELTITLFLRNCYKTWCFAPVEWLALVKHSTGIMRAVMLGLLQLSLQFKGVHSSADPLEKHWVYISPSHTSPVRFFHLQSQCRFSQSLNLHRCHGSFPVTQLTVICLVDPYLMFIKPNM